MRFGTLTTALTLAVGAATLFAPVSRADSVLVTDDQRRIDEKAVQLLADPAVKEVREAVLKQWSSLPTAKSADGQKLLDEAVDEATFAGVRAAVADPAHPIVQWIETAPYSLGKLQVSGSRLAGDSPDRIYRQIAVSPAYRYEIRGKRNAQPSLDAFSFEASNFTALAVLTSKDIDVAADGSFVVTADSTPANGQRNHLTLPEGTVSILIRDTLSDWSRQQPNILTVKRIDGAEASPRTEEELRRDAVNEVTKGAKFTHDWLSKASQTPANTLKALVRPLEFGVKGAIIATGRFDIGEDEALVVTVAPEDAQYVGFQVLDPWFRSIPYWNRISSLSDRQAKRNADGSLTYIIAAKDPGYHNWIDTGGLKEGLILSRIENFTATPDVNKVVREAKIVKLENLAAALPKDAAKISRAERAQQIEQRGADYLRRLQG